MASAVPGQLSVVIAGQHHHVVARPGGEARHRLGELGVGIEDPAHIWRAGQHLEAVSGDDEGSRAVALTQDGCQFVGHRVEVGVATAGRWRSLTTTVRLPGRQLELDRLAEKRHRRVSRRPRPDQVPISPAAPG
jgi:hypothetical protein